MPLNKPGFLYLFSPNMPAFVTDYDVAMAYEFFLGRTPESSAVISDHKQRRFDDLVTRFIHSDEFIESTAQPLRRGESVGRLDYTKGPNRSQISWLIKNFVMEPQAQQALYTKKSWDEFFHSFLRLDSVDPAPAPMVADVAHVAEEILPLPAEEALTEPQEFSKWDIPATVQTVAPVNAQVIAKLAEIEILIADIRLLLSQSEI